MDRVELSIGNVVIVSLIAFLGIPGVLLTAKYVSRTSIPVVSDIARGTVSIWKVAA